MMLTPFHVVCQNKEVMGFTDFILTLSHVSLVRKGYCAPHIFIALVSCPSCVYENIFLHT